MIPEVKFASKWKKSGIPQGADFITWFSSFIHLCGPIPAVVWPTHPHKSLTGKCPTDYFFPPTLKRQLVHYNKNVACTEPRAHHVAHSHSAGSHWLLRSLAVWCFWFFSPVFMSVLFSYWATCTVFFLREIVILKENPGLWNIYLSLFLPVIAKQPKSPCQFLNHIYAIKYIQTCSFKSIVLSEVSACWFCSPSITHLMHS